MNQKQSVAILDYAKQYTVAQQNHWAKNNDDQHDEQL